MLERATRFFEWSARPSWRATKRCLQSQRQLHSAFWHHGASDLDVATYCLHAVQHIFEPLSARYRGNIRGGLSPNPAHADALLFLDWLYPPGAQAVLRNWSVKSYRWYQRRTRVHTPDQFRPYSSTLSPPQQSNHTHDSSGTSSITKPWAPPVEWTNVAAQHVEEVHATLSPTEEDGRESIRWLTELLEDAASLRPDAVSEEVWRRYQNVPQSARTLPLRKTVVHFLARSSHIIDNERAAMICDTFGFDEFDQPVADVAVDVLSRAGKLKHAVDLHSKLIRSKQKITLHLETTQTLFMQCFDERDWANALRVLSYQYSNHSETDLYSEVFRPWLEKLVAELQQTPSFFEAISDLVEFVSSRRIKYFGTPRYQHVFGVIMNGFFRHGPSLEQHWTLLRRLVSMRQARSAYFEKTFLSFAKDIENSAEKSRTLLDLHHEYRTSQEYHPTIPYLDALLSVAFSVRNESLIADIRHDIATFGLDMPFKTGVKLMRWFGRQSDVVEIRNILADCLQVEDPPDVAALHPLLRAEAIRHGAASVEHRLEWLKEHFDIYPDPEAYHILLQAYARSNDLNSCVRVLQQIVAACQQPQPRTIEQILSVCAHRGDVALAKKYLQLALERNMYISAAMFDHVVQAHLNADQFEQAVKLAERVTRNMPDYATRVWTTILSDAAVHRRHRRAFSVSRQMHAREVPFNGESYAALMRIFTETKRPELALGMMRDHMDRDDVKPTALHYAIVIDGYSTVNRFATAWRLYAHMLKQGVKPNMSSRLALFKLESLTVQHHLAQDRPFHPGTRFHVLEELLEETMNEDPADLLDLRGTHILFFNYREFEALPAAFFDGLLSLYSKLNGWETVLTLLEKFAAKRAELQRGDPKQVSVRILYHMMHLRLAQNDVEGVLALWQQAKKLAGRKTAIDEHSSDSATDNQSDPLSSTHSLPKVSRHLLSSHFSVFVRALTRLRDFDRVAAAVREIHTSGFALSSSAWNSFVSNLVRHGYIIEAFELAESRLLPSFKGFNPWDHVALQSGHTGPVGKISRTAGSVITSTHSNSDVEVAMGLKSKGMEYMGRKYEFTFSGELHVSYSTLLFLRRALIDLGDELMGGEAASGQRAELEIAQAQAGAPDTGRFTGDSTSQAFTNAAITESSTSQAQSDISNNDQHTAFSNGALPIGPSDDSDVFDVDSATQDPTLPVNSTLARIKSMAPATYRACRDLPALSHGRARHIIGQSALARIQEHEKRLRTDPKYKTATGVSKRERQNRKNRRQRATARMREAEGHKKLEERAKSQSDMAERISRGSRDSFEQQYSGNRSESLDVPARANGFGPDAEDLLVDRDNAEVEIDSASEETNRKRTNTHMQGGTSDAEGHRQYEGYVY